MRRFYIIPDKIFLHKELEYIRKVKEYTSECITRQLTEEEKVKYNIKIK